MPSRRVLATGLTLLISMSVAAPGALLAASPDLTSPPVAEPTPAPTWPPVAEPTPAPTWPPVVEPTPSPSPTPAPSPTPSPKPTPKPSPKPPVSLNLYKSAGFRYQNPSYITCTSTSVMDMLNFVSLGHRGGAHFRWSRSLSSRTRDAILRWERAHHTMVGGHGTDVHGWRNALNYYGWGWGALRAGSRVYEDVSFASYGSAMKAAVRAMISTRKPVAMAAWAGKHAVMITGYYGLSGNPFAKDRDGRYANTFRVGGFYLSDPLKEDGRRNARISYTTLGHSSDGSLRFRQYRETDSPYDDPYTPGHRASKSEWYGKWVLILPVR